MILSVSQRSFQRGSGLSRERRQPVVSGGTSAFGAEAESQAGQWQLLLDTFLGSVYLGDRLDASLSRLAELLAEADEGLLENTGAIEPSTRFLAYRILQELPKDLQPDDLSIDPDGDIALDWVGSDLDQFALSISSRGSIAFAGLIGGNPVTGRADYSGSLVPREVLSNILRFR